MCREWHCADLCDALSKKDALKFLKLGLQEFSNHLASSENPEPMPKAPSNPKLVQEFLPYLPKGKKAEPGLVKCVVHANRFNLVQYMLDAEGLFVRRLDRTQNCLSLWPVMVVLMVFCGSSESSNMLPWSYQDDEGSRRDALAHEEGHERSCQQDER